MRSLGEVSPSTSFVCPPPLQLPSSPSVLSFHNVGLSFILLLALCPNVPVSMSSSVAVQCLIVLMSKCPKWPVVTVFQCASVPISLCPNVPVSWSLNVPMSQCPNVPVSQCPSVLVSPAIFKPAVAPIHTSTIPTLPQCVFILVSLQILAKKPVAMVSYQALGFTNEDTCKQMI